MHKRGIRGRSAIPGFAVSRGRVETRLRMLERLRPEGGFVPFDLQANDVVADLDPGLVDWRTNLVR